MILQHLITFCRVVETGGFARAGALVGLSQPAVTRQVAALEAELGTPLLDRSSRQFHLTPAGEMVYERARRLAQSVEELREAVEDLTHPERGRIAIGAVTTVGLGLLPPILSEFTREYPGVRLQVKAGRTQETLARLLEAEIEMAVVDQVRALLRQPEIVVGTWRAARREAPELTEGETQDALHRLDPLWEQLFPAEQARIVRSLVERVVVGPAGADIRLRLDGLGGLVRDLTAISPSALVAAA